MSVNVDEGVQVEHRGVVGRIGDRFPLAAPMGVVTVDGSPVVDGRWTPFGMTMRVVSVDPVPIDLTRVGYDEISQTSVWPHGTPSAKTSPPTRIATSDTTDGHQGSDTTPDSVGDVGID